MFMNVCIYLWKYKNTQFGLISIMLKDRKGKKEN